MLTCQAGNKSSAFELMTGHPTQDPGWMLGFYYLVHCIHVTGKHNVSSAVLGGWREDCVGWEIR